MYLKQYQIDYLDKLENDHNKLIQKIREDYKKIQSIVNENINEYKVNSTSKYIDFINNIENYLSTVQNDFLDNVSSYILDEYHIYLNYPEFNKNRILKLVKLGMMGCYSWKSYLRQHDSNLNIKNI